ncbi:sarcoplasmic calcium-binding protein [Lingula anatina]|uniref:Sarcoplasmic calcium-binding protein n=1 Tax=Lingula anatina TaxID=7574 RepID=A0A1S3JBC7_LINAN|nr:sarcoplasmic calcium-binding protein [Lingula anatina]|eukprot:XP_013407491.1 sarcoplasmic calcium-binding protein [Lingula anatina]
MAGRLFSRRILNGVFFRSFSMKGINLKKGPHDYPVPTGSDHWRRKIRTLFKSMDTDGDGYVTKKDFELSAHRLTSYLNLNEKKAKEVLKMRLLAWEVVSKGKHDDCSISEDEYVSSIYDACSAYSELFIKIIISECDFADANDDGFITRDEHKAFFYGRGVPVKHSADVFKVLDTDGDGILSREEFIQGAVDFVFSEDENSPYVHFIGPLV